MSIYPCDFQIVCMSCDTNKNHNICTAYMFAHTQPIFGQYKLPLRELLDNNLTVMSVYSEYRVTIFYLLFVSMTTIIYSRIRGFNISKEKEERKNNLKVITSITIIKSV